MPRQEDERRAVEHFCACGCGQKLWPDRDGIFHTYAQGHNARTKRNLPADGQALLAEFDGMAKKVAWRYSRMTNHNAAGALSYEDLYQEARFALLRRGGEIDGIDGREARGLKAWGLMTSWVWAKVQEARWRKGNDDDGTELVPIIAHSENGDFTTLDLVPPEDDDYGAIELRETLKAILPEREYRIVMMRATGMKWQDIGVEVGFNGHAGEAAKASLKLALKRYGITDRDGLLDGGPDDLAQRKADYEARALRQPSKAMPSAT